MSVWRVGGVRDVIIQTSYASIPKCIPYTFTILTKQKFWEFLVREIFLSEED